MGKLIATTQATLDGVIDPVGEWVQPDGDHGDYSFERQARSSGMVLGRKTYEGLSAAYTAMAAGDEVTGFVTRMNSIPKHVATRTLQTLSWNATALGADVAGELAAIKQQGDGYLLKYGTGPLDKTLIEHGLVDEFRIWIVPVTTPPGQRLFEDVGSVGMELTSSVTLSSGVVVLSYAPRRQTG